MILLLVVIIYQQNLTRLILSVDIFPRFIHCACVERLPADHHFPFFCEQHLCQYVHSPGSRTAENLGPEEFAGQLSDGPYQKVFLPNTWSPADVPLQNWSNSVLIIRPDTGFIGHFEAWVQKSSSHLPTLLQGPLHDQVSAVPIAMVCRLASLAAIPCNNIGK